MFGCSWSPQLLHVECYGECGGWNACPQILWRWQTVVANQCQQNRLYLSSCFSCGLNLFVWSYICGRREKPSSMIYYKPCPTMKICSSMFEWMYICVLWMDECVGLDVHLFINRLPLWKIDYLVHQIQDYRLNWKFGYHNFTKTSWAHLLHLSLDPQ